MKEIKIDWLIETDFIRACFALEKGRGSYREVAETAVRIYLERTPTLAPERVDEIFQDWQVAPERYGQQPGDAVWDFKELIKQELEGNARTKQRNP